MRTKRVTLLLVLSTAVAAVAPGLGIPAQAAHSPRFLQVTPEISVLPLGGVLTLKAQLFLDVAGSRVASAPLMDVTVNFEEVTATPASLTATSCVIAATTSSCEVTASSGEQAAATFRAWIADDTKDTTETRRANSTASASAAADCLSAEEGESANAACTSEDAPDGPGAAEPDATDVVKGTWLERGVDVVPDDQVVEPGKRATFTVTAYQIDGTPLNGVKVFIEYFNLSVSDGDGNSTGPQGQNADGSCTTQGNGTCTVGYTQTKEGVDLLCAWVAQTAPALTGTRDGGTCGGEGLVDATANDGRPQPVNDSQDVFRVTWARPPAVTPPPPTGYWLAATDGGVFAFGDAGFRGSTGAIKLNKPMVGLAGAPGDRGYWMVASDGGVFAFGEARFVGSAGAIKLNQPIVGMDSTPSGSGYFLVARDGGVFAFGDAVFRGSTGALKLNQPIVGMAASPTGRGYWLVAADGGIFAFGDAVFRGSTGALKLNQPIVGMAATPSGQGYWLVARDGGIFAFGDARFQGSTGALKLNQPMVGMSRTTSGLGYRLVAADGGIFAFGDAKFLGSTGAIKLNQPMVGMDGF